MKKFIQNIRGFFAKPNVKQSLPYFIRRKTMIEFCEWSKQAEWQDGERKTAFIQNDWKKYIRLFLEQKKKGNVV